ncbi:MAG: HTH domain-containing protein [Thermoplasmatota archaeon]
MIVFFCQITSPSLLADRLDVSRRTVYNDLDHIREDILSDEELETEEFVVEVLIRNRAVNRRLWDIVNREETPDNIRLGP